MVDERLILTVKELTRTVKRLLDGNELLQDVWVRGEISNFNRHTSGHMYFTLKDADSRIRCVMFASQNKRLPFMPRDGMKVLARGGVSVFERDGQYQLYVAEMQPDGIGSLHLAFEQLKQKLAAEGLFDSRRKKPLPRFPRVVGVITSPTGAAVRDIVTTLRRRYPAVRILLCPVHVQGVQAAPSIVRAIEWMNRLGEADVLIVGRGGGSLEELWAFNEEAVARALAASRIPVLSAVGHETDFTIADFVADVRAATPTAAAELAVPHVAELRETLRHFTARLQRGLAGKLADSRAKWERLHRSPAFANPRKILLRQPAERLDRLTEQLVYRMKAVYAERQQRRLRLAQTLSGFNPKEQVLFARKRTETLGRQLVQAARLMVKDKRTELQGRIRQLDALSPLKVMQRGYGLVYDRSERQLIHSIAQVQPGDLIYVRLADGRLECHVWSMEEKTDGYGENRA